MNTLYRRKLFSLVNIAAVVLMSLGVFLSPSAFASLTTYSGDLQFSLLMPGSKTNLFGFGGLSSTFETRVIVLDNATASAKEGAATSFKVPIVPPPADGHDVRSGRAVHNVDVSGTAGPGNGRSYAESKGALFARLLNLSGGSSTPPGQIFNAVFDLSYEYNLVTAIANPLLEDARAQVGFYARAKPEFGGDWTTYFSGSDSISGTGAVNRFGNRQFSIPMAQNSITLFEAQFFVLGQAISIAQTPLPPLPPIPPPPPVAVPEPSSLMLSATGCVGLLIASRSRRRRAPTKVA